MSHNLIDILKEHRCEGCDKLLFKGLLVDSQLEVKCVRCGLFNNFQGKSASDHICLVADCPHRVKIASTN